MRLIGIAGPARSGKDTAALEIVESLGPAWGRASFADPIKSMLNHIGVDTGDNYKDLPTNQYGVSTRHMMQTLGTDWGRALIDADIWVSIFAAMNRGASLVVPDVRFENEAQLVRDHGVLIHIMGRGGIPGGHVSEQRLQVLPGDYVINNDGGLALFSERLAAISPALDSPVNWCNT